MKRSLSRALPRARFGDWLPWLVLATGAVLATPSHALYKVVGPDGKITYTDRAPSSSEGRVSPIAGSTAAATAAAEPALPAELRQAAGRYPVVLYTASGACEPCDAARQLLRQRGVPYSEKQVLSPEDGEALQRLSGGRDAPTLTIGSQTLRGLAGEVWNSYLDSAGYPRESKLPQGYQYPAPTPITERREAAPRAAAAPAPAVAPPPAPAPAAAPNPAAIKF
jgi:glutaredoxin